VGGKPLANDEQAKEMEFVATFDATGFEHFKQQFVAVVSFICAVGLFVALDIRWQ